MKIIVKDEKGEIKRYAKKCMKRWDQFKPLKRFKILYTWRMTDEPSYDQRERKPIMAETKRITNKYRDLYGYDVEINVWRGGWLEMNNKRRLRLLFHELTHIIPSLTEDFQVETDDDGRLKYTLAEHDVHVATFTDEIQEFGLHSGDVKVAEVLSEALVKRKAKKKK